MYAPGRSSSSDRLEERTPILKRHRHPRTFASCSEEILRMSSGPPTRRATANRRGVSLAVGRAVHEQRDQHIDVADVYLGNGFGAISWPCGDARDGDEVLSPAGPPLWTAAVSLTGAPGALSLTRVPIGPDLATSPQDQSRTKALVASTQTTDWRGVSRSAEDRRLAGERLFAADELRQDPLRRR